MIGAAKRRRVWERDQGICGICNEPVPFDLAEADHIIPRSFGGSNDMSNLQAAHKACNRRKSYRVPGYYTTREAAERLGWTYSLLVSRVQWNGIQTVANRVGTNLISEDEINRVERDGWQQPRGIRPRPKYRMGPNGMTRVLRGET